MKLSHNVRSAALLALLTTVLGSAACAMPVDTGATETSTSTSAVTQTSPFTTMRGAVRRKFTSSVAANPALQEALSKQIAGSVGRAKGFGVVDGKAFFPIQVGPLVNQPAVRDSFLGVASNRVLVIEAYAEANPNWVRVDPSLVSAAKLREMYELLTRTMVSTLALDIAQFPVDSSLTDVAAQIEEIMEYLYSQALEAGGEADGAWYDFLFFGGDDKLNGAMDAAGNESAPQGEDRKDGAWEDPDGDWLPNWLDPNDDGDNRSDWTDNTPVDPDNDSACVPVIVYVSNGHTITNLGNGIIPLEQTFVRVQQFTNLSVAQYRYGAMNFRVRFH